MQFLKLLLIVVLLLLPLGELLRFNFGNNVYLKPLDLMVGLTSLVWFYYYCKQKKKQTIQNYFYLFPLIGLLSLLVHAPYLQGKELLVSGLYLMRFIAYLSMVYVVAHFTKNVKENILKILFYVGMGFVLLGYLQYFFFNDLRYFIFMGWDDHLYRLFSTFLDPNFAGTFLVLYLIFVAGIYFSKKDPIINLPKYFLLLCLVIILVAIFLTFSRSALIMLIVASIVFLVMVQKKRLVFGLLGTLLIFVAVVSPFFSIENMNLFRTVSSQARLTTAQNALTIIQDHPLLGVGFNSYRYFQQSYGFRQENPRYPSNADAGVDNSWLFVLATTGILGFSAYVYLWFSLLKNAYVLRKNMLAKVIISSAAGLFINAFFINSLFFVPIMLWMWMLYGLLKEE